MGRLGSQSTFQVSTSVREKFPLSKISQQAQQAQIKLMNPNTNILKFKNLEEVKAYAERQDKVLVLHDNKILDCTSFLEHHPGGGILIKNQHLKDIKEQMQFHHPLTLTMADSMAIGSFKNEIYRLVDYNQPLAYQIWKADHQKYLKIVNSPHWMFMESPRIFGSDIMQALTHNKWYFVPVVPCIMIAYKLYNFDSWETFNPLTFVLAALFGLLLFSLVEYCLHRFIFHSETYIPNNRVIRYLHFMSHGIHHLLPNDPDRLVLPSALFIILYYIFVECFVWNLIKFQDPVVSAVAWVFFLVGYMIYDISHYAFHFVDTTNYKGSWFHKLQKYHNRHHFSGQDAGFGVSTPLWDVILNTGYKNKAKK